MGDLKSLEFHAVASGVKRKPQLETLDPLQNKSGLMILLKQFKSAH